MKILMIRVKSGPYQGFCILRVCGFVVSAKKVKSFKRFFNKKAEKARKEKGERSKGVERWAVPKIYDTAWKHNT